MLDDVSNEFRPEVMSERESEPGVLELFAQVDDRTLF
jgi:hypothetical protein